MPYTSSHRHAPISPRKVRLIADLVRGKGVNEALSILKFQPQRAARMLEKVIQSAQANANDRGVNDVDSLFVSKAFVDGAPMLKRWQPRARGGAGSILKRRAHINIELDVR